MYYIIPLEGPFCCCPPLISIVPNSELWTEARENICFLKSTISRRETKADVMSTTTGHPLVFVHLLHLGSVDWSPVLACMTCSGSGSWQASDLVQCCWHVHSHALTKHKQLSSRAKCVLMPKCYYFHRDLRPGQLLSLVTANAKRFSRWFFTFWMEIHKRSLCSNKMADMLFWSISKIDVFMRNPKKQWRKIFRRLPKLHKQWMNIKHYER